ncbi:MAG: magnesium transporter [Chromatiaceae bacterium]
MIEDTTVEVTSEPIAPIEERIRLVHESMRTDEASKLADAVAEWPTGETAAVLEALPLPERQRFWELVPDELRGEVLAWLGDQVRASLLEKLEVGEAVAAATTMETPDLALVVEEASDELREAILESLSPDERALVEDALGFPEDSAGRLMEREWVAVRADVRLEVVRRYLGYRGSLPHRTDGLMVVDREGIYLGKLPLEAILTKGAQMTVAEVMDGAADCVNSLVPLREVAALFQRRDLVSMPVVDDTHRLVGRIILDDAIHLIRTEAEQPMMHMAGLEVDEDLLAPIAASARRRLLWLGVNLATAFLAAGVIGLFEATLSKIVALAVLMPVVASMGGIAGSQTLTLAIRGLALGQITDANTRWLAVKEVTISVINGIVWALVVGAIAWLWFRSPGIALVLGAAMILNLLAAAAAGLAVPLILQRLGLDPALSGSVILTTVTDVVGFMSFLGLATIFLL